MSNADKEAIPENGDKSAFQMKRQNPDNRGGHPAGGSKRYRADPYNEALAEGKFEFRFLLPTKCAGAVIGRGGENIKAVRDKVRVLFCCFDLLEYSENNTIYPGTLFLFGDIRLP